MLAATRSSTISNRQQLVVMCAKSLVEGGPYCLVVLDDQEDTHAAIVRGGASHEPAVTAFTWGAPTAAGPQTRRPAPSSATAV